MARETKQEIIDRYEAERSAVRDRHRVKVNFLEDDVRGKVAELDKLRNELWQANETARETDVDLKIANIKLANAESRLDEWRVYMAPNSKPAGGPDREGTG